MTLLAPTSPAAGRVETAGQWRLTWRKFRRHKLALIGGVITLLIYLVAILAEFVAPFAPESYNPIYAFAPPQPLQLFRVDEDGFHLEPHVDGYRVEIDRNAGRRIYTTDPDVVVPVGFFVAGEPYKLWGLIETDIHLVAPLNARDPMYLFGTDRLGRDMLSRIVFGARVSMSVGLVGVVISFLLGVLLGGLSGYLGGVVDTVIQRVIEFLQSLPAIPLWIGLAAAIPLNVPPLQVYFLVTLILSFLGWTGLARVVRGRFLAMKSEDFIKAARLDGASTLTIIFKHMLPSFMSHVIAVASLAVPGMIISETALSYLGVGLRAPIISWGVLLEEAQNIRSLATAPWLLLPGAAVAITVLAMNFLGDGLRDATDPHA